MPLDLSSSGGEAFQKAVIEDDSTEETVSGNFNRYYEFLADAKDVASQLRLGENIDSRLAHLRQRVEELSDDDIPLEGGRPMLIVELLESEEPTFSKQMINSFNSSTSASNGSPHEPAHIPRLELDKLKSTSISPSTRGSENTATPRRRKRHYEETLEEEEKMKVAAQSLRSTASPTPSVSTSLSARLRSSDLSLIDFLYLFIVIVVIFAFYRYMSHQHCPHEHPI